MHVLFLFIVDQSLSVLRVLERFASSFYLLLLFHLIGGVRHNGFLEFDELSAGCMLVQTLEVFLVVGELVYDGVFNC